jgi:Transglutaminase-like superfamily
MRKLLLFLAPMLLILVVIAVTHDVELQASGRDAAAARQLMAAGPRSEPSSFEEEVALVRSVQDRVLATAPVDREIPQGQPRELADLARAGHGLCFDRSRAIETILRLQGMRTRHAAIYSTRATGSALRSLATPGVDSHAITEVMTRRGWMIVDSNSRWIGLSRANQPVELAELRDRPSGPWHRSVAEPLPPIYNAPFTWIYGLYSRHGRFYPPYNPVPDVNWAELVENL